MAIVLPFIVVLIMLLSLWKEKSRLLTTILLFFLFTVSVYANGQWTDYNNYLRIYETWQIDGGNEVVFRAIVSLFRTLGITYDFFKAIITLVIFCFIAFKVKKNTQSVALVTALCLIYPGIITVELTQFFVGFAICYVSLQYLVEKGADGIPLYIVGCILASLTHNVFVFCLFVPLVFVKNRKLLFGICILIVLFLVIMQVSGVLSTIIMHYFRNEVGYSQYFEHTNANNIFKVLIQSYIVHSIRVILMNYLCNRFGVNLSEPERKINISRGVIQIKRKTERLHRVDPNNYSFYYVIKINYIFLLLPVFEVFTGQFARLYRLLYLINAVCIGRLLDINRGNSQRQMTIKLFSVIYMLLEIITYIVLGSEGVQGVLYSAFFENEAFWFLQ